MTALHTLAAFLVLNGVEPTAAKADCLPDDNGCKARRSEQRAASAPTPDQRATYLRSAHRSYLFLFDKTGDVMDLCSARRAFDASLAVKDQSADERARTQVLQDDLVARERQAGAACKGVAKPRRASKSDTPPVVASVPDWKAPPDDAPARTAPTSEPPPLLTNAPTSEPAPSNPPPPSPRRPDDEMFMPIPSRGTPPRPHAPLPDQGLASPRPGRGLLIAGGVTLGAGVVLTVAAGYLGRHSTETRQQYFAIVDMVGGGFGTEEQDAAAGALFHDYNAMRTHALALGVAGGATIVLAAVLAGLGGRRMARAASRTALVPVPGGLALHARF